MHLTLQLRPPPSSKDRGTIPPQRNEQRLPLSPLVSSADTINNKSYFWSAIELKKYGTSAPFVMKYYLDANPRSRICISPHRNGKRTQMNQWPNGLSSAASCSLSGQPGAYRKPGIRTGSQHHSLLLLFPASGIQEHSDR